MLAILVREPFHLTLDRFQRLTPRQVRRIYFRQEMQQQRGKVTSYREIFFWHHRRHGKTEAQILQLWREQAQPH